ncbi:diflavin oxidoreductase [Gordonia humi]|uniref:assimilatory sulfite reductase (NADPH) n=1 Tax=Gordonia humi TaxID=686429 RepID=A0A840EN59_9ACTN|nr:flavodoxin domain-containing protein [Gordonia humi]MBB4134235.1 sulfite reductase (NADPH) flavoprotein alpha-component [Gordonia humi]
MSSNDRPFIHVLFGTQTGNAEVIAMDAADALAADGFETKLMSMDEFDASDLEEMHHVVVVSSTYDDGNMPDNAQDLWDGLEADAPDLTSMRFAVLALGDSSYDHFCEAGRLFDVKFGELGAQRLLDRVDCDLDYESPSKQWVEVVKTTFASLGDADAPVETVAVEISPSSTVPARWTRQDPYLATVENRTVLSGDGSLKSVLHLEVDLGDSGIEYLPGDSLGLIPANPTPLVDGVLEALAVDPDTTFPGGEETWREELTHRRELRLPGNDLIEWAAAESGDVELVHLRDNGDREALESWLWGRDVLDLITMVPADKRSSADVAGLLGSLQHRSYSISSGPTESPKKADLLVSNVAYHRDGRDRVGAGSSTIGVDGAQQVSVFLAPNPSFRLPADDAPAIMVGPGVGVAPFRSFLLERRARGAKGKNWLFFGDQRESCDFLYRDELTEWQEQGLLANLSTAFSRDQEHKIYVQDRLREQGAEVFTWLQDGAHFYICGDGVSMSHAVEAALIEVIVKHGGLAEYAAWDYLADLKRQRRYSQDVY